MNTLKNLRREVVYLEAIQHELDFLTVTEKTDAEELTLGGRKRPTTDTQSFRRCILLAYYLIDKTGPLIPNSCQRATQA